MSDTLVLVALTLLVSADPVADTPRRPHPFAPSLPELTDAEEANIDRVIDRFILYDTGRLKGPEGTKALRDFEKLGSEAIPGLIRGLNRAARIEHSCPAAVLSKKLGRMLGASEDTELLQFARDEIGSGVGRSRHMGMLQDLRVAVLLRRNSLIRAGVTPPKPIRSMTVVELAKAADKETGQKQREILAELEQRRGPEPIAALARAASHGSADTRKFARELLERHLYRQPVEIVKQKLRDDQAEVRRAAAELVGQRMPALTGDLIDLLADRDADVRAAAHSALLQFSKGKDFGPSNDADAATRAGAIKKWKAWWQAELRAN